MPPSKDFCRADIKLETKVPVSKKKSDLMDVRTAGMETIQSYQEYEVQVYTDGSATNGTSRAGYGARIEHHVGTCERIAEPCGVHCSNFEAEAMAIQSAIDRVSQKYSDTVERVRVVIFTDSKSVLQALDNYSLKDKVIETLTEKISSFIRENKNRSLIL